MIRRSTAIATVAIVLSLMVHFVGLSFTSRVQPERRVEDPKNDVVALGNAFEDVAESLPEPVPPEKAPTPEPPAEAVPEPERAEVPSSEALVGSADPQRTASPDTGSAKAVQPEAAEPVELEHGRIPDPETITAGYLILKQLPKRRKETRTRARHLLRQSLQLSRHPGRPLRLRRNRFLA